MDEAPISENVDSYEDEREAPGEMLETSLAQVPRRAPVIVEPSTSVREVIAQLNDAGCGCALVVDGGALVGIFTERDVLTRIAGQPHDRHSLPVSELMTRNPDTLPTDASVAYALNRMSVEGYRHIPLLDEDGSAVGVVGMRDIIRWMVELYPSRVLNIPPGPKSFPRTPEGA